MESYKTNKIGKNLVCIEVQGMVMVAMMRRNSGIDVCRWSYTTGTMEKVYHDCCDFDRLNERLIDKILNHISNL